MIPCIRIVLLWLFFIPVVAFAQYPLTLSSENTKKGASIYVSSTAYCPMSLSLSLTMDNATFAYDKQPFFVVPARAQHFKLGDVNIYDIRQVWHFTYQIKQACWGDLHITSYDSLYEYALPWPKNLAFPVIQGYNGSFSHQGIYAIDFGMPEGTAVLAAREGIVMEVVQEYSVGCLEDSCKKRGNLVIIYQPDGTMATYAHIRHNGSVVKPGDRVNKGDTLAYSGNTGYSAGPHLHFTCALPGVERQITIATKFIIRPGQEAGYLLMGQRYTKEIE